MATRPNIVLVHGAWADGSSWSAVIERLQGAGYKVTAPQFALGPIANDAARLRTVLSMQDGPTVVAGHSYGGQIMTALGADAPNAPRRSARRLLNRKRNEREQAMPWSPRPSGPAFYE
jgi:pimeloyl-ACP methyl ester carboxylesterase